MKKFPSLTTKFFIIKWIIILGKMGFNLKKILRALLFSTSEPLSIKDIQAVVTRYHSELENAKKAAAKNAEQSDSDIQMPPDPQLEEPRGENPAEQTEIEDIMSQVPTLLTATQIREAMEEIAGELDESGDVCRLLHILSAGEASPYSRQ